MPKTYRKKPIEIQAARLTLENIARVKDWCSGEATIHNNEPAIAITTLEGTMFADLGDYVIKEPHPTADRKFYPCKPDIFEASYDLVPDPTDKVETIAIGDPIPMSDPEADDEQPCTCGHVKKLHIPSGCGVALCECTTFTLAVRS